MSRLTGIWKTLNLEPTNNVRAIKRAYAKQITLYHPEEYPEKFQEIHAAYELALEWAKTGRTQSGFERVPLFEEQKKKSVKDSHEAEWANAKSQREDPNSKSEAESPKSEDQPELKDVLPDDYEELKNVSPDYQEDEQFKKREKDSEKLKNVGPDYQEDGQPKKRGKEADSPQDLDDPDWLESEKIGRLTEKYAREEEKRKIRNSLQKQFIIDSALDKLRNIIREKKIQDNRSWTNYFQDKQVLWAFSYAAFQKEFLRLVENLRFSKSTREMMKEVYVNHILDEEQKNEELDAFFMRKTIKTNVKTQNMVIFRYVLITLGCLALVSLGRSVISLTQEKSPLETYHEVDKIEDYLDEKYQTTCTVAPSDVKDFSMRKIVHGQDGTWEDYVIQAEEDDVTFHAAWKKDSMDYDEILDDYEDCLFEKYAKQYNLNIGYLVAYNNEIHLEPDTTLEIFAPTFLNFLKDIQKSDYVQGGHEMEINVQLLFFEPRYTIKVEKDQEIDEQEIQRIITKCLETNYENS
ncbi:MAG: hypothetical protein PHC41_05725 [Lachnospiraceae bacterium]|nr:hypothetical protein [Lachnospiraceae bacterium]MDD3615710.1 hypothetical protein [Lachnospiraceae bacterium]